MGYEWGVSSEATLLPCPSDTPMAAPRLSLPVLIAAAALAVIVSSTLIWATAPISLDDL